MAELIHGLEPEKIRANLERVRETAGAEVELLAATKYVPAEEMGALAEAGVRLVGENRLQEMEEKQERWADAFEWDFIGNLQSRKVKSLLPVCRLIHSVASDSALEQLGRHADPETEVLVEVNVAGEEGKSGVDPAELGAVHRALPGPGRRADDDAALHRGPGALASPLRTTCRARRRARAGPPFDGHEPGLGGRRSRGSDDRAAGNDPLHLVRRSAA